MYLQLHHMASIATGMCLSWLLFSFFFLPLHCHVVYAHVEQSSQCANRYACKHRLLYVYAYVNYDSTLHKIPNWNQKQELSDNNKENEPDIINNLCIFVPGAMNRSSQRLLEQAVLDSRVPYRDWVSWCPFCRVGTGPSVSGHLDRVTTLLMLMYALCNFFALSIIIQNLSWNSIS
mgnify:CR=1 FL=1